MAKAPHEQPPNLLAQAEQIAREFDLSPDHVLRLTRHFVLQMKDGLANTRAWQLPAYVRSVPTGKETGEFLAVDLGGSNCRICLVELHGNSEFTVTQSKHSIPPSVMVNHSYFPLFDFIAQKIAEFLAEHLGLDGQDTNVGDHPPYKLGFTFSFTCEQTSLASGRLIRWDKGWDIPDAVGQDPCVMLQEAINKLGLPVSVMVLANDSVGTLLTRSYSSGPKTSTLGAVIFGTGTNAAYVEKLSNIQRLGIKANTDDIMVINSEWGCLDDKMEVLPRTPFDDTLDQESTDPGSQMLEKRVSGLYLGELLRLAILQLIRTGAFRMKVDNESQVFQRGGIDSSFLSKLAAAATSGVENSIELIQNTLSIERVDEADAQAIQLLATSIARRAGRLAGASLAALIIQSGRLETSHKGVKHLDQDQGYQSRTTANLSMTSVERFRSHLSILWRRFLNFVGMSSLIWKRSSRMPPQYTPESPAACQEEEIIDIGADGSLIEFYPTFEAEMRGAMREVPEVGYAGEQRVRIGLAKDGSGVGAALMAQAASQSETEAVKNM